MEVPFTFEEIVLQRIFDLKNEVVREFESHQRLYKEALISICFLKGIDPPPSLVINSGAAAKTSQHKDSRNSFSLNGLFSEAYGGFFCTKRGSSSADRPAGYQVAAKRRRLEKSLEGFEKNVDGGPKIAGDESVVDKGHCVDAQKEEKLDSPQAFVDGFEELEKQEEKESDNCHGEDNCRVGGRRSTRENSQNGHMDRWDEKREGGEGGGEEENGDANVVHRGGRGRGRGRGRERGRVGAKEKKNKSDVAAVPVIGRITRSKARQCQVILSAKKESGKRKAMESKEKPQATRITRARRNLQAEVEVSEEPMDVAATVSPSACPQMAASLHTGNRDSSSPLPCPGTAVLSQAGGPAKTSLLPSPVIVVVSQTGGTCHSSPLISPVKAVPSQTGSRVSLTSFPSPVVVVASQTRVRGKSSSEINEIYLKGDSISRVRKTKSNIAPQTYCSSSPPQMTSTSQVVYPSADLITGPLIEVNPSSPSVEPVPTQLEINAIGDNASHREEIMTVEMKKNSLKPVCEDSNDMNCMSIPQEQTTKIIQGCTGGWPSSSPMMTLQQNEDDSAAPVMIQLEVFGIRGNAGHEEEIATAEVKLNSLDPVFEGCIDMDHKKILQKDTPMIDQEFAEEWPPPRPYCGNCADMKDAEQSEALCAIETIQLRDTSNIIENGQISHVASPGMQIPNQLQNNLCPLEIRALSNITQVDSGSVRNASMLPEMPTSQCCIPYPKYNLRSRSVGLDRCRSVLVKETMSDSKLLVSIKQAHNAMEGREEFSLKKEMPFIKFARLCKPSDMLYSQGNQGQNNFSHKEGTPSVEVAMEESAGDEDTETPISHDAFQKTSTIRSSSFENDAGKESAERELEKSPSAAALHFSCQSFPVVTEDLSIHSVKNGGIEGSYDNTIEPVWSDCIAVRNTLNHGTDECEKGSEKHSQKGRPTSSMDMSVKAPSEEEEDLTSQMVEVTELGAVKHDESSLSLKSVVFPGKVETFDSDLRSFCRVQTGIRKKEILCDASRNTPLDFKDGIPSIQGKLFSRNMIPWKEDQAQKLQNKSWPGYQKQNSLAQEDFSSARHSGLLRSESCSKVYNLSVEGATLGGVGQYDMVENNEQRHDDMLIFSPKNVSLVAFPVQQNASLLSSEMKRDDILSPKDIECRQMARLLLNEHFKGGKLSMKLGYPRRSCLTDLEEQKSLTTNEVYSRNFPSYTSYAKNKEGSLSCTGLPQFRVDDMSSNYTSVSYLLDKTDLHARPSKSQSFGSSFEVTSPQDRGQQGDSKIVPSDDAISEFSFQKGLGDMDKCDIERTPSMKRNVVSELGQHGLSESVAVNKKPSNQFGLQSSLGADCHCEVANDGLAKGVGDIPGMQGMMESYHRFSSTRNAVDSISHDNLFPSTILGSIHEIEMSQGFKMGKTCTIEGKPIECQEKDNLVNRDKEATDFYNALRSFTPVNQMLKCRKYTPSNARWAYLSSDSSDHSENSIKCLGKGYPPEIDYSDSLTPAGGILFDRTVTNSVDTDSNLFAKQVQEHTRCFPIEEESLIEEENMDYRTATNTTQKGFSSLTKKNVLSTKNILTDSAKHNSPVATPPTGNFCKRIVTSSTEKRPDLLKKKALVSPKFNSTNLGGQASIKENLSELRNRYGSSVRKKDSKTPSVRTGSSFASQISPRISQKPSNILCNVKSFIPLVQQKQAAASVMTGKREIKVKALEAAEVAKRLEEKRDQERKMRKELVRRGEHEKKIFEKSKEEVDRGEKEGEESNIACSASNKSISSDMARKKPVQSQAGTSVIGVDLKLRKALETKNKLEKERLRKLEEKKQKEEDRKKNAAEVAANKRKREEMDKKDREEKRRRLEEAQKLQKELEEQLRAEKEAKEQRRRALDDYERKKKAMEEDAKKQRRIEKEREAAERRRQIEEDAKSNKFASKDAKHMQEVQQNEKTLQAQNAYAGKVSSSSTNCAKDAYETKGQSLLGSNANSHLSSKSNINIESYEISPYKGSDEEDNDDGNPEKPIPLWARKEQLIPHIISQQYIDPDEIFTGARTCSLNEVFETNGSNRRRDFKRRSYSGEWLNDCFTWKEEYQYKVQMGYINKAE